MTINNVYEAYKTYNVNGAGRQRRAETAEKRSQDTFSLSVQAEDYQLARKAVSNLPDIRQEKVSSLQSQITNGSYTVSAAMVADRILQNSAY